MKKYISLIAAMIIFCVSASGCTALDLCFKIIDTIDSFVEEEEQVSQAEIDMKQKLDANTAIYPFYASLDETEKLSYTKICVSIESCNDEFFFLAEYGSILDFDAANENIVSFLDMLLYEQPQYFWVDHCHYSTSKTENNGVYILWLKLFYLIEEDEIGAKQTELDMRVDEIVTMANAMPDTYGKVLCVYDEILETTDYDYELAELNEWKDLSPTAYGCLIEGDTVCSGYALAFNLIMQELGFESGAEFSHYAQDEDYETDEAGHVWNYCKLDGEYYYFDLTWDDNAENEKEYYDHSYFYFAVTTDELRADENREYSEHATTPLCTGTQYNYFVYNGMYFDKYEYKTAKASIKEQLKDNDYIMLKFAGKEERDKAKKSLIDRENIYDLVNQDEIYYYTSDDVGYYLCVFL
ncbi:MAG: hypothetical protein U0L48_09220 [Acutalibacteraceae bacterium]|nr:hypothetical protein [Acutalibacteraceae bacterium]